MDASTRTIDYHLEERIEGQKPKITLSGSYPQGQSVQFIAQNIQNHVQRKTSKAINPVLWRFYFSSLSWVSGPYLDT
jgi:hypothetical protein